MGKSDNLADHRTCPKCGGRMERGFQVESDHGGSHHPAAWHPGAPRKVWWGFRIDRKALRPIATYRCQRCCFLEDYAA